MGSSHNYQRVFADVISLDAWHEPFRLDQETYGVFAELSFTEGRMGGDEPEIPFTFNVRLKKALLSIRLEDPLTLDRASVARGIPAKQAEYTQVVRAKEAARSYVGIGAKITPALIGAALNGDVSKSTEISEEEELRISQEVPEILVTARPDGAHGYSWEMEPLLGNHLRGQPWDPIDPPRMRVYLPESSAIDPTIKVEVRCALEDLEITSILPKEESLVEKLTGLPRREINEAAAIQHLKKVLTDVELYPGKMDNRFNSVILADVLALST